MSAAICSASCTNARHVVWAATRSAMHRCMRRGASPALQHVTRGGCPTCRTASPAQHGEVACPQSGWCDYAGRCRLQCLLRPNPCKGLGDHETAHGRKWPCDLVTVKAGESPARGRLGRVGHVPHTEASWRRNAPARRSPQGGFRSQDHGLRVEGTWRAQARRGRWTAQTCHPRRQTPGCGCRDAVVYR